ncbi:hypothetical protein ACROYT_G043683 [Oculina patagonica]
MDTSFIRVLENLESLGIILLHYKSPGKRQPILRGYGNALNSSNTRILRTNIIRNVWQTAKILRVKRSIGICSPGEINLSSGKVLEKSWKKGTNPVNIKHAFQSSGPPDLYYRVATKKYLNATKDSQITICTEQINVSTESSAAAENLKPKQKEIDAINGRIAGIDANKLYFCLNCKGRIPCDDSAADNSDFLKCPSCHLTMLKNSMSSTVSANVNVIQGAESIGRFYCSPGALSAMFQSISKTDGYNIEEADPNKLSCDMIEKTLLLIDKVAFKISKQDKIIESMEVAGTTPIS